MHTASPFLIKIPKDENELIRPAVEGTLTVMKAALKYKVKRVVVTSSISAIAITKDLKKKEFNTDDWSDISIANPYDKSKTLAERAAWDFL